MNDTVKKYSLEFLLTFAAAFLVPVAAAFAGIDSFRDVDWITVADAAGVAGVRAVIVAAVALVARKTTGARKGVAKW